MAEGIIDDTLPAVQSESDFLASGFNGRSGFIPILGITSTGTAGEDEVATAFAVVWLMEPSRRFNLFGIVSNLNSYRVHHIFS